MRQCTPQERNAPSTSLAERASTLAAALEKEFGVPFALFDATSGTVLISEGQVSSRAGWNAKTLEPSEVVALVREGRPRLVPRPGEGYQLVLILYVQRRPAFVAAAEMPSLLGADSPAAAQARERVRLEGWLQAVSDRLRLNDQLASRRHAEEVQRAQATTAWEALLALEEVARDVRIQKNPAENQRRILGAAYTSLRVRALIWVPAETAEPIVVLGESLLTQDECQQLVRALAQSPDFQEAAPLLCNQPYTTRWGRRFPQVENLMAFALSAHNPGGWFLAVNKDDGSPFRFTDAALLLPFVAFLEAQRRWAHRYHDLKELLVGLTRALATALDAKDPYTYGHSERVARIAVELGRELQLEADQLGDIYLAGLLHDVGKIGIHDTVLHKQEALSPEEQEHIREHVLIGYSILADLRQIRNLLPGVLYHHERYDGQGYPDGLAGEEIPLLARILAVADAYDAMSHPRSYREAMPNRQVEETLRAGAGSQWDNRLVEAFCRRRQQIYAIRQRGVGDSLRVAIDGALRSFSASVRPVLRGDALPDTVLADNSARTEP